MKNKHLHEILIMLYVEKRKIQITEIPKYIKIIRLYALKGIIDNSLAYGLTYKILMSIKPLYIQEV